MACGCNIPRLPTAYRKPGVLLRYMNPIFISICCLSAILFLFNANCLSAEDTASARDNDMMSSLLTPAAPALFSADGRPLRRYAAADGLFREPVSLDRVSPWAILAIMAAEDKRFFEHGGVDVKAIARAAAQNIKAGRTVSGASTITQQLYRAYNPGPHNFRRKISEAAAAMQIENKHSKEEILQAYLNMIPFGNNLAGIQAASLYYFGVNAEDLTLSQAAGLAGLPQGPSLYNPITRPEMFEKRRLKILEMMLSAGYIDEEAYRLAAADRPEAMKPRQPFFAPHFSDWASSKSAGRHSVITTLIPEIQEAAQSAIRNNIKKLEKKNHITNGAAIVLDNRTGAVLAWAGSKDFFDSKNHGQIDGVRILRQPGSALKPFLYGLAFSKGHSPADLISDEPFHGSDGYSPLNYDKKNHGMVRMREALANSYNIPAVRIAEETGPETFLETLHSFGFESLKKDGNYYGAGLSLGNGEVTLLELANGYASLARGGIWRPVIFEKEKVSPPGRRVLDERSAFLVTSVLSDNHARIAAFGEDSPLHMPFDIAAKTGTSKDYRDNWTAGYTPEWTIAVWAGNFDGSPMRRASGITGAAPIMREIAMFLHNFIGSSDFKKPLGIAEIEICPESGLPASDDCPSRITEYFNSSFIPKEKCTIPHNSPDYSSEYWHSAHSGRKNDSLQVEFPKNGDIFKIDPSYPIAAQGLAFKASRNAKNPEWHLDGKRFKNEIWKLQEGSHELYFKDGNKKSAVIHFRVVR